MGLMYRSVHEPPDLSAVPPELRELVASCLAKEPDRRPSPTRFLDLLDESADPEAATSYPLAPPHPPSAPPPDLPLRAPGRRPCGGGRPGRGADGDGEAFAAADVDSGIVVDSDGVMLTLHGRGLPPDRAETGEDLDRDGVEIDFSWPEIAGLVHRTARRTRLHITVTLHDGSVFESEIKAHRAARAQAWNRDLAAAIARHRQG
ncbi:hypothetical protein SHKM778_86810 [Streptomyces sp. KM77-8]|uniref:Serine/threonine protein kinase n=1 Tax=Streptomyces haneummycinicus TaxID=3074435 RepID=A0AAT9HX69_9ACTN